MVAIFNVQDKGNLVFDVGNSVGTFELCGSSSHDREYIEEIRSERRGFAEREEEEKRGAEN